MIQQTQQSFQIVCAEFRFEIRKNALCLGRVGRDQTSPLSRDINYGASPIRGMRVPRA
ncbi:hypothetical protein AIOL_002954 [Candidatus Rhodobacter oscarellae]|uniref:Uncharacterized protein n=1 Tax=Candidatus Rhodobacter oscarellae TaxID=1675527 RepID=A0A0J9E5M7_9RHOB|nr:hypothetical protein AIOL_002954 [Candidatus Rhodobacter lobularis]